VRDLTRAFAIATDPHGARDAVTGLVAAGRTLLEVASDAPPPLPWNAELGWRRRLALSELPLADALRIALAHGCELSDVIVSTVAGAMHGYLRSGGTPLPRADGRVLVPVCVRDHDAPSDGATLSAKVVSVPIASADERSRFGALVSALRGSDARGGARPASALPLDLVGRLPPIVARMLAGGLRPERLANVFAATIDGPREPRWLCGRSLIALHPFLPVVDGIGLSFATYAYSGKLFVGIQTDADLVPDLDKLRLEFEHSFQALSRSA
jgi:hypothetical protein